MNTDVNTNPTEGIITKCSTKLKASDALGSLGLKAKLHFPTLHSEKLDCSIMVPNHNL